MPSPFISPKLLSANLFLALLLAACGTSAQNEAGVGGESDTEEDTQAATPLDPEALDAPDDLLPEQPPPAGAERQFSTDFSIHIVDYDEVLSGGPPKDGIPAIDNPKYVSIAEADEWIEDVEPIILYQVGEDARAFPIQILMWHEIANAEVGSEPVAITFCPLCNTAIAFKRTVDGQVLDFGTTGRLRFSNLIMYDRQTETWWQQATGQAIAGVQTGKQLEFANAPIISWAQFKESHPDGTVLSRDTGHFRQYGSNPYAGYDNINNSPFLYRGHEILDALPPMARVLTVDYKGETVAYPFDVLQEVQVVNDTIGGVEVVVIWEAGTASALDSGIIARGQDVGTANVYLRELEGQTLTFSFDGEEVIDDQTHSTWNTLGQATGGELAGAQLTPLVAVNHFWFSWSVFMPETRVYTQ